MHIRFHMGFLTEDLGVSGRHVCVPLSLQGIGVGFTSFIGLTDLCCPSKMIRKATILNAKYFFDVKKKITRYIRVFLVVALTVALKGPVPALLKARTAV